MKTVFILNKTYKNEISFDKQYLHDSGPLFSNDRFLQITQQTFDAHMKVKSKPLFYFMNWWFQTNNYKLNPQISKSKRSLKSWLVEIFFWLCILGLIVCILVGVARPVIDAIVKTVSLGQGRFSGDLIVNGHTIAVGLKGGNDVLKGEVAISQWELIPEVWTYQFKDASVIVPLLFTLIFFFFSFLYIYMIKKIRPRTNKMSLEDYLVARMNMINFFKGIFKKKVNLVHGIKEYNHQFVFNMKIDYNLMRIINYIYSGFFEMNIVMVIDVKDDNEIFDLQKVVKQDFSNLGVIVLQKEDAEKLKSNYQNGTLSADHQNINIINAEEEDKNQETVELDIN